MKQLVSVVVPILKSTKPDLIQQSLRVLHLYDIIWLTGEHTVLPAWTSSYKEALVYRLEDKYFESEEAFTRLLLSKKLYERFDWCEFIFLVDTYTVVQKDELTYWCKQGYDYIQPIKSGLPTNLFISFFKEEKVLLLENDKINNFTSLRRVDRMLASTKRLYKKALQFCEQRNLPQSDWLFWEQNTHPWKTGLRVPTPINRNRFGRIHPSKEEANHLFIVIP